jgi:hypothetical protein
MAESLRFFELFAISVTENIGVLFFTAAWVQGPFGKVLENLNFQMNRIFKENIKNYAAFPNNATNTAV